LGPFWAAARSGDGGIALVGFLRLPRPGLSTARRLRIRLYELLDPLAPAYLVLGVRVTLVSALLGDVELIELSTRIRFAIVRRYSRARRVLIVLSWLAPGLALVLVPFLVAVALTPLIRLSTGGQARR